MNKCLRCGHTWLPRIRGHIRQCPNCKSIRWNKPHSQTSAIGAVRKAIKEGKLAKLDGSIACTDCGKIATVYDHRDYAKPLEVQPVCQSCNVKRGRAANQGEDARVFTIRLSPEDWETAKHIAELDGVSVSHIIRRALLKYINEYQAKATAQNNCSQSS